VPVNNDGVFGKLSLSDRGGDRRVRRRRLNLEQARRLGKLEEFAQQHPASGDMGLFERTLARMARVRPSPAANPPPEREEDR
jgi:hypothetical protein